MQILLHRASVHKQVKLVLVLVNLVGVKNQPWTDPLDIPARKCPLIPLCRILPVGLQISKAKTHTLRLNKRLNFRTVGEIKLQIIRLSQLTLSIQVLVECNQIMVRLSNTTQDSEINPFTCESQTSEISLIANHRSWTSRTSISKTGLHNLKTGLYNLRLTNLLSH